MKKLTSESYRVTIARYERLVSRSRSPQRARTRRAPDSYGAWMKVNCVIDPRDDIFRFFATHPLASQSGARIPLGRLAHALGAHPRDRERRPLAAASAGRCWNSPRASGASRATSLKVMPGRVTCLGRPAGIGGFHPRRAGRAGLLLGERRPRRCASRGQYDLVFVLSLFTHLPPDAWSAWLREAFRRGGARAASLVFSVHNEAHARELGVTFDADGSHFIASSESPPAGRRNLRNHVHHARLRRARGRRRAAGQRPHYREIAFWDGQDAVIVGKPL